MKPAREISIKPACMTDIQAFPKQLAPQLWEKIDYLVNDPVPDGKVKVKIKGQRELYRLRLGDHRIFYTFGDGWVRLLGIRRRNERTYDDAGSVAIDRPVAPPDTGEDDLDELVQGEDRQRSFRFDPTPKLNQLPRLLTPEYLAGLNIPPGYFPVLASCTTEEELLSINVPSAILDRVLDDLYPRSLEEIAQQPDLIVQDTADLVRYKEGDLIGFLLKLDEDQKDLANWALKGPTMIKGGAGTGKSTVALYRVKSLLERPGATGQESVLFTTYTQALIKASRQLLSQLLSPQQQKRVRVASCDEIAREVVISAPGRKVGQVATSSDLLSLLRGVRRDFTPAAQSATDRRLRLMALEKLSDGYLLDEFEWIIDGRGLATLDEYQDAPRPGRGNVFRAGLRETVWQLHQAFLDEVRRQGLERFAALRKEALGLVRSGVFKERFDHVVVDEAQDLSPAALGMMAELARSEEGLFFASDSKQSLYSRNYTWASAHPRLQFTGRTAHLKRNYRSTAEIDRAAFAVLAPEEGEDLESSASIHTGPLPVLAREVPVDAEGEWAARFIRQMCRHLRMRTDAAAVLASTRRAGERLAEQLTSAGVPAKYFAGRDLDLRADVVKVLTLHSAKGLEFPVVVVAGFETDSYPVPENYDDPAVYQERMRHERRLLYVGLSRAMRGLMLIVPQGCTHEALASLDGKLWHTETAT